MAFKKKLDSGSGEVVKFDSIGQSITGYYGGSFDYQGDYAPTKKHLFKLDTDGTLVVVFGQTHLIGLLEGIVPGTLVRVTHTGVAPAKKKGQHPMKLFEVEYDDENVIDPSDMQASAEDNGEPDYEQEAAEEEPAPAPVSARPASRPALASRAPVAAAASKPAATAPSSEARARVQALLAKR